VRNLPAGVHVKILSERLGHSSTSSTMDAYSAVILSMGRTGADAADQVFGSRWPEPAPHGDPAV
jgi:integrase